jgi:hypothetical protein
LRWLITFQDSKTAVAAQFGPLAAIIETMGKWWTMVRGKKPLMGAAFV